MSRRSQVTSLAIHLVLLAMLLLWRAKQPTPAVEREVAHIVYLPALHTAGGGGGTRSPEPARKGVLPQPTAAIFIPPTTHLVDYQPKLSVPIAMDSPPEVTVTASQLGDPNGRGVLGGGPGGPDGLGDGVGHTVGSGTGKFSGDGNGVFSVGHGVSLPIPIHRTEPEYSEAARRARISGSVTVYAEIGPDGKPRNLRVTKGIGLGLDAKALEAVEKWLFKPGMRDGKPVTVKANFEVNFRLL